MKVRLLHKTLAITTLWVVLLMLLATPAFYWLTKEYYTDEITDLIEDVKKGKPLPNKLDIQEDIAQGVVIQFGIVLGVFAIGVIASTMFISRKLWKPFKGSLKAIDSFRLEEGKIPTLPKSNIKEFSDLNHSLDLLMSNNLKSYTIQKEFTENASHELQTPMAVIRGKLDQLIQLPGLTEAQGEIINEIYEVTSQMSKLSRNLLLLSKIENNQFAKKTPIWIDKTLEDVLSSLEPLLENISHQVDIDEHQKPIQGNPSLTEALISNLIINAIRYTADNKPIEIKLKDNILSISNYSDSAPLDQTKLFDRFYRPDEQAKGNGLGLAIVKSICQYHNWRVSYQYKDHRHVFSLDFNPSPAHSWN